MARPITIRTEDILVVARRLFLEHGLSVSTAVIAKEAGVSEGTIFKRFATKEALFKEAMRLVGPKLELEGRVGRGALEDELADVGVRLIAFFQEILPRMMRLWAHTEEEPMKLLKNEGPDAPPLRLMRAMTEYLAAEQALGRLGEVEPQLMARMFIASMHNYVFLAVVSGPEAPAMSPEAYARGVVATLWRGVAPRTKGRRKT
jgi:AcrR family transcriptional regulator